MIQTLSESLQKLVHKENGKINFFDLSKDDLKEFLECLGEKPYRITQLMKWVYHRGIFDFDLMTDISKVTREKIKAMLYFSLPEVITEKPSTDGTRKWLIKVDQGNAIEMVFIPEEKRGTLCVSSQVGCALECSFCSTAQQGFNRNLSTAEMIGQLMLAKVLVGEYQETEEPNDNIPFEADKRIISNVVLMGMGEPLLNFNAVIKFINLCQDDLAFGLSKRRVTISTSGVVPAIYRLKELTDVALAISLHAPYDTLRNELVPINKKYPIAELLKACHEYVKDQSSHSKITWEYVMLAGVNDRDEDAHALATLIKPIPGKVNLIPFNPFPESQYKRSSNNRIDQFRQILIQYGIVTVTRKTRGDDIDAACGQLAGKIIDKSNRSNKKLNLKTD